MEFRSPPFSPLNRSVHSQTTWVRDDGGSLLIAGMIWLLAILMIVPEGFNYEALGVSYAPTSGAALSRLLWLSLLGVGVLVILRRASFAWLLLRSLNPFFVAFVVLAACSAAWSIEPTFTVRRTMRMATIAIDCFAFALVAWHPQRLQRVVRPLLTLVLLGSIFFALAFPKLGIHQETSAELVGAWRGLANHKNTFGALASITMIFWFHSWLTKQVRPLRALAGCTLAAVCLVLSRSSTSAASTVAVMLLLIVLLRMRENTRSIAPFFVVLLTGMLLTYALIILKVLPGSHFLLTPITALTGKDSNFTGRTQIWEIISRHIELNPYFGSGYGGYWIGPLLRSPSHEFIDRMYGFYPGSAHNGYLEVLNDLGWAGLLCLLLYIANYVWQSLQLLRIDSTQSALLLGIFFQQLMTNLSETHWFSAFSVDFVITTLATVALARAILEVRLRSLFQVPAQQNRATARAWIPRRPAFPHDSQS